MSIGPSLAATVALLAIAISLAVAVLLLGLLRHYAETVAVLREFGIHRSAIQIPKASVGDLLPDEPVLTADGERWSLGEVVGPEFDGVMLLVTSGCPACDAILSQVTALMDSGWRGTSMVIEVGPLLDHQENGVTPASWRHFYDPDSNLVRRLGLKMLPSMVKVREGRIFASPVEGNPAVMAALDKLLVGADPT